jgi:hypothetical protein
MRRRLASLALVATAVALGLAACGGGSSTAGPSRSTPPAITATPGVTATPRIPTEVPGGNGNTPPPAPGTFETAWGEAWDALPPGFPVPPESEPADPADPAEGPVSGAFVIDVSPEDAAALQQVGLVAAGYSTEALSGPFEDGSLVIDSVGSAPECRIQTRIRELGGTTLITVLFGAACPWG